MSLRKAHAVHVRNTVDALKAEIAAPIRAALPEHALIALGNAAISIQIAESRIHGGWEGVNIQTAIAHIAKARRLLNEAEAAINGIAAQ
jgi:hypothetical protein